LAGSRRVWRSAEGSWRGFEVVWRAWRRGRRDRGGDRRGRREGVEGVGVVVEGREGVAGAMVAHQDHRSAWGFAGKTSGKIGTASCCHCED
jgi:hypothetical protein